MKTLRRIITFGLVVIMFVGVFGYATTDSMNDGESPGVGYSTEEECLAQYEPDYLLRNEASALKYEKLMKEFIVDRDTLEAVYPDYYGGTYTDSEGNFVVYITEGFDSQEIEKLLGTDFITKDAKYSFSYLTNVMDALNEYKNMNFDSPVSQNFPSYYLNDMDNNVVVEMEDMSEEQIGSFKKHVMDSSAIIFEKHLEDTVPFGDLEPGRILDPNTSAPSSYLLPFYGIQGTEKWG